VGEGEGGGRMCGCRGARAPRGGQGGENRAPWHCQGSPTTRSTLWPAFPRACLLGEMALAAATHHARRSVRGSATFLRNKQTVVCLDEQIGCGGNRASSVDRLRPVGFYFFFFIRGVAVWGQTRNDGPGERVRARPGRGPACSVFEDGIQPARQRSRWFCWPRTGARSWPRRSRWRCRWAARGPSVRVQPSHRF